MANQNECCVFFIAHEKRFTFYAQSKTDAYSCCPYYGAYTKLKVKHSKRRGIVKCTDEDTRFHYSLIEMKNRNYNE